MEAKKLDISDAQGVLAKSGKPYMELKKIEVQHLSGHSMKFAFCSYDSILLKRYW